MDVFTSAAEFLSHRRPERPVLALRPHAAQRAARWLIDNFPGRVLYAAKANDARPIIDALVDAGIRAFDVASLVEIERVAGIPGAELFFMNPVKSRGSIARAGPNPFHATDYKRWAKVAVPPLDEAAPGGNPDAARLSCG